MTLCGRNYTYRARYHEDTHTLHAGASCLQKNLRIHILESLSSASCFTGRLVDEGEREAGSRGAPAADATTSHGILFSAPVHFQVYKVALLQALKQ